jgi:hypothetical protein
MYFMATSSFVTLFLISLATPKLPEPKSLTASYLSIVIMELLRKKRERETERNYGLRKGKEWN